MAWRSIGVKIFADGDGSDWRTLRPPSTTRTTPARALAYGSFNRGQLLGIEIGDVRRSATWSAPTALIDALRRGDVRHRPGLDPHPRRRGRFTREPGRRRCRCSTRTPCRTTCRRGSRCRAASAARRTTTRASRRSQLQHDLRRPRQPDQGLGPAHVEGRHVLQKSLKDQTSFTNHNGVINFNDNTSNPFDTSRGGQRGHRRVQQLHAGQRLLERRVPATGTSSGSRRTTGRSTIG